MVVAMIAAVLAAGALAGPAGAATGPAGTATGPAGTAGGATRFKPRIAGAMGIEPAHGSAATATGPAIPAAYHGGSVMRDFTIHTVFWAPGGAHFDGPPAPGTSGYEALVQQFLADVAHDSGTASNIFSLLDQYGDHAGAGSYHIHYDPAADSVTDSDPYPSQSRQCVSPSGIATCITDLQVEQEVNRVIGAHDAPARGLTNVWFVLLPPDVDECVSPGACGTTQFAGYHSAFQLGQGSTIYAVIPDPLIEFTPPPGSDPEGNPEAEAAIDTIAHETTEAATNPLGDAWMDPNGFEVADKCEDGGEQGTPLGFAAGGAPYNQLINGHPYLVQDIWSNSRGGCVQSSPTVASIPALHTIDLRQFSPMLSGSIGTPRRVPVIVALARGGKPVALAVTTTRANGSWGPVKLRGRDGRPHAVGDDRDQLQIDYGFSKTSPTPDFIQTGDGGNPFTESGWTGWLDLDHGYAVHTGTVVVSPCSQTGVLSLRAGAALSESPVDLCSTETDAAEVPVGRVGTGTALTLSSEDNRGEYQLNPDGTLVTLTVALGEPASISALSNAQLPFTPTGFPTCTAFLRIRSVSCGGLVPGARYALRRGGETVGRGVAGKAGVVTIDGVAMKGGDVLTLQDGAGRRLTSLHVAHLRVDISGNQTQIASGTCEPGDYWGRPVTRPPTAGQVGLGIAGTGTICPDSGRAQGLSTSDIAQTDDFSGGETETQVPGIRSTSPLQDETLYGSFVASAQSGLPGPHGSISATGVPVALTIVTAASRHRVFHAANVDTTAGVAVPALAPGAYVASWVLHDAAGDTRTLTTRFVDEP
jgi:hypothetical protein